MPQAESLLSTKLSIPPPCPVLVPRPRLIEKLNTRPWGKLTLISAPAGYGKTTLVSVWAQQVDQPVLWYSLDESDNDLSNFLAYFIAALHALNEHIGVDVLIALEAAQLPQTEILLTTLINEIAANGEPFTLVLDDCHLITSQAVYNALEFLIYHLPQVMHLVLVGRVDPPIPLSRLRAGGQLTEIRSGDLRFTVEEAEAFFNDLMDLALSTEDITALDVRTEGWIAGLQLAALSMQGREDKQAFIQSFSGTHYYIIDYLVEEVLSRQTEEIRSFLCRTSILERLSAPLCNATLGILGSREILKQLEGAGLFLFPMDEGRRWYRYHHLFAEFLEVCLEQDTELEPIRLLHRRAAGWYEQKEFFSDALRHLLKAEDFEEAARLVEQNARRLLERSELATLMRWVNALPDEHVRTRPRLCIYHAWAIRLSGGHMGDVESRLQAAEAVLENQDRVASPVDPREQVAFSEEEVRSLKGHIISLRAFQALYRDKISQVIELAQQAYTYQPEESFVRSSIAFALGWAYRFSGDLEAAEKAFDEVRTISLASGNTFMAASSLCRAAYGQVLAGRLYQAVESFKHAVTIATREDGRRLPVAGYAYVYMGGVYREWNDLDSAGRYILEGIDLCKRVGYLMDQVVGYANLTRVRLAQKNWDAASEACQDARRMSQKMDAYIYARRWVEDCQVRLWLSRGNLDAIDRWVDDCGMYVNDDLTFMRDMEHTILARALVVLGQDQPKRSYIDDSLALLERLLELAENAGWLGRAVEILVLQALAYQVKGQEEESLAVLSKVLTLAEPHGYVRLFIDEGEPMAVLLRKAADWGISPGYVGSLLASFESEQRMGYTAPSSPLVDMLSERELEVLRLLATDLTGPEIARELMVALSTVRYHTNNIYSKLSVHNRRTAVRRAQELNLLS